jgi:hypothetical protein
MTNLYFVRQQKGKVPFTYEELAKLLSSDFLILNTKITPEGNISDLVLKSTKHPEINGLDPICKGIGFYFDKDSGYWMDPRFYKDHEIFFSEVLPDLMTDLELNYGDSML